MRGAKIGLLLGMASMMSANNEMYGDDRPVRYAKKESSHEEWKRKKCKSCGHFDGSKPCYGGKWMKPKSNACRKWEKK
jgi:hypothetical protein